MTVREGATRTTGVVLAGGRSQRMGAVDKRFSDLLGKPLLQWVIDRASPQVDQLLINAPQTADLAAYALPVVPDLAPGHRGPLMGLYSAMTWSRQQREQGSDEWLALFACDTPFVPEHLVATLLDAAGSQQTDIALAATGGQLQPTASVWRLSLLPAIKRAVELEQAAGFLHFLQQHSFATASWPVADSWRFHNVNTPADLIAAASLAAAYSPC